MASIQNYTIFDFAQYLYQIDCSLNIPNILNIGAIKLSVEEKNRIQANVILNKYEFHLGKKRFTDNKNLIIICTKNNSELLSYTLSKIRKYKEYYDILLVDDRSDNNEIVKVSDEFETSYLRIDNSSNCFNYSLLNNIASLYAIKNNKETLIFHNNDLWSNNESTLTNILEKHQKFNSHITGCKLVYPTKDEYDNIGNPQHLLEEYIDHAHNTIQHGGINFILRQSPFEDDNRKYYGNDLSLSPVHTWRFFPLETEMASLDTRCFAITGALQIIDTKVFVDLDGFDIGLTSSFQDIDLCIKAAAKNYHINYIGSEFMYHAESITYAQEKINFDPDAMSDHILWDWKWSIKLPYILGLQYYA